MQTRTRDDCITLSAGEAHSSSSETILATRNANEIRCLARSIVSQTCSVWWSRTSPLRSHDVPSQLDGENLIFAEKSSIWGDHACSSLLQFIKGNIEHAGRANDFSGLVPAVNIRSTGIFSRAVCLQVLGIPVHSICAWYSENDYTRQMTAVTAAG